MAERVRGKCSDNIINDITYNKRPIEYKAYLMKSKHSEKAIDKAFCKRATIPGRETLKKESNRKQKKIKLITVCETSLSNIYSIWRKTNQLKIMNN